MRWYRVIGQQVGLLEVVQESRPEECFWDLIRAKRAF